MPNLRDIPTRADLEALLPEIILVINQSYAFVLWFTHVYPALKDCESGYLLVLRNNLMAGTLLNLRKLNEFFRKDGCVHDDDARACHFPGFKGDGPFLSNRDLKQIHKRFAHL